MSETDPADPLFDTSGVTIEGVSRARVSADGADVAIALRDQAGGEHGFLLSFEDLSRSMVQLLAVQRTAGTRRKATRPPPPDDFRPIERDLLLPFPVASWQIGRTQENDRLVLRLTSDNDLVWDFLLPGEMETRLIEDLERARALAAERWEDDPE